MTTQIHLQPIIKNLPSQPGVYRYYDADGNVVTDASKGKQKFTTLNIQLLRLKKMRCCWKIL